jgi:hypothetical protein
MTSTRELASLVALVGLLLVGCDTPTSVIRGGALRNYVAGVRVNEVQGQINSGEAPAAGAGPSITLPANLQTITGGSAAFQMTTSAPVLSLVAFVQAVGGYYLVPLGSPISSGQVVLTLGGLPPALDFQVTFAVAGADGVYGPYSTLNVSAVKAAGGDIQVSVTWNTDADVDLHVVEPGGAEIYYGSPTSGSGGELDIDANAACSVSGLTQENIGWPAGRAAPGAYIVRVDYWDACGAVQTDYIVTVSLRPGVPSVPGLPGSGVQIFSGTFTGLGDQGGRGDGETITTFIF